MSQSEYRVMSETALASDGNGAIAAEHCEHGGDATATEVGGETSADAVQLVGVPGELENPVEGFDVDKPAEDTAHAGAHLM